MVFGYKQEPEKSEKRVQNSKWRVKEANKMGKKWEGWGNIRPYEVDKAFVGEKTEERGKVTRKVESQAR